MSSSSSRRWDLRVALGLALLWAAAAGPRALAGAPLVDGVQLRVGDEIARFYNYRRGHWRAMMSGEACGKPRHFKECQAWLALQRAGVPKIDAGMLKGGRQMGALICLRLGGESLNGTDRYLNEYGICRFEDKSQIIESALEISARNY